MSRSKSLNFDFYLLLKRMLNEQLTSYFPSEYFIMIALIIGLGFFSDGKKKNVGEYYFIQLNVENYIFGKGKTKNVVDAKSIEEIFFLFWFYPNLSDFVFSCCPNNFVNFILTVLLQRLRNNHPFVASFSRAIRSGDVTNLLETMSRLSDKVCRKGHVLH